MWIIPSNLPLSSASALEYLGSSEDLKELASIPVSWPTWKSKPTSLQTWLRAWKRVYWIQHLFGRTLKPSMHDHFVEEYTASLAVIHVSRSVLSENKTVMNTNSISGHISLIQPTLFDPYSASSKMLSTTSILDTKKSNPIWKELVTQLRKEFIQRKRSAPLIEENDCSSLHWPTPRSSPNENRQTKPTPSQRAGKHGMNLSVSVQLWVTPSARDHKDSPGMIAQRKDGKSRLDQLARQVFHWDKDINNIHGKSREQLNPAWVAQLMGTTLEKIFFVPLATAWLSKQQN